MYGELTAVLTPRAQADFVETLYIKDLTERALAYIKADFPVHFSGPAGVGKTTLAFHVAAQLGRPVALICGDYEFGTSDLVGGQYGYRRRKVVDHYIQSVLKTDEDLTQHWVDNRLTTACEQGFTLIYDEFTRSRPEANNVLLSVLEEGLLPLPAVRRGQNYLKVHPDFTAILTSNPEEYAGVYRSQDALRDRIVTIELGHFDEETEVAITQAKSGLSAYESEHIVNLVRRVRVAKSSGLTPTVRACIIIGKVLKLRGSYAQASDGIFRQICLDVLTSELVKDERERVREIIEGTIGTY